MTRHDICVQQFCSKAKVGSVKHKIVRQPNVVDKSELGYNSIFIISFVKAHYDVIEETGYLGDADDVNLA